MFVNKHRILTNCAKLETVSNATQVQNRQHAIFSPRSINPRKGSRVTRNSRNSSAHEIPGDFWEFFFRFEFYFLSSLIVQYHVNVIFIEFSFQTSVNYTSVKAVNSTVLLQYYSINYLQRSFSYFVCDVRRQTLHKFVCGDGSRRDIMVSDAKFCLNDSFCYPWDENLGRNFDGFRGFLFPPPSPIGIKCVRVEGLLTSSSTPNFTWIGWSTL